MSFTAYNTTGGQAGSSTGNYAVGDRFTVVTSIQITEVGAYVNPSVAWSVDKTIEVWDDTSTLLHSQIIHIGDSTTLVGQARMLTLGTPWTLTPGTYRIVCNNYLVDAFVNSGGAAVTTFNSGSGLITDVSVCFGDPGTWPNSTTGADSMAGATFRFQGATATIAVTPGTATVNQSQTLQLTAVASDGGTPTITWSCLHGTITSGGLYTAPAVAESDTITAAATSYTSGTCTVTIPAAAAVAISSLSATANDPTGITLSTTITGGVGSITIRFYRHTTAPFTPPGTGTLAGTVVSSLSTTATYKDTAPVQGTANYYRAVVTDSAGSPTTATSNQGVFSGLTVTSLLARWRYKGRQIGAIGTSITAGYASGTTPLAQLLLAWSVNPDYYLVGTNQGEVGSKVTDWLSGAGLAYAATAITAFNAAVIDTLIVELGMNDLGVSSPSAFQTALISVITNILANVPTITKIYIAETTYPWPGAFSGSEPESAPPAAILYRPAWAAAAAAFSGKAWVIAQGMVESFGENASSWLNDVDVHPNTTGSTILGQKYYADINAIENGSSGGINSLVGRGLVS